MLVTWSSDQLQIVHIVNQIYSKSGVVVLVLMLFAVCICIFWCIYICICCLYFHRLVYLYLYSVEVDIDNGDGWKAALVTWSDRVGGWSPTSAANNTTWQLLETTSELFAKICWFLEIVCQLQAHSVKSML